MRRLALALLGVLALPATAAAQTPPAPTPTPPPAVPTPAPPPAATAKLSVSSQAADESAALAGRAFTARVVMKPYVANEGAVLRVYRGKRRSRSSADVQAGRRRGVGRGRVQGQLEVGGHGDAEGVAPGDPGLATTVAKPIQVSVVNAYAGPGSKGPQVKWLQNKLASLHYVTSRSGVYDSATGRAIMAWRKVAGYSRTYTATADVYAGMLKGRGVFKVRHPKDGRHVEARLNQQVLALINGSKVERIYHTSRASRRPPPSRASSAST